VLIIIINMVCITMETMYSCFPLYNVRRDVCKRRDVRRSAASLGSRQVAALLITPPFYNSTFSVGLFKLGAIQQPSNLLPIKRPNEYHRMVNCGETFYANGMFRNISTRCYNIYNGYLGVCPAGTIVGNCMFQQ